MDQGPQAISFGANFLRTWALGKLDLAFASGPNVQAPLSRETQLYHAKSNFSCHESIDRLVQNAKAHTHVQASN